MAGKTSKLHHNQILEVLVHEDVMFGLDYYFILASGCLHIIPGVGELQIGPKSVFMIFVSSTV